MAKGNRVTNKEKELQELIKNSDPVRVEAYLQMMQRILVYSLATRLMPKDELSQTIQFCDNLVKKSIDIDASHRTEFLESTPMGRTAKLMKEPDGEDVRLHGLQQWSVARTIIEANLLGRDDEFGSD